MEPRGDVAWLIYLASLKDMKRKRFSFLSCCFWIDKADYIANLINGVFFFFSLTLFVIAQETREGNYRLLTMVVSPSEEI